MDSQAVYIRNVEDTENTEAMINFFSERIYPLLLRKNVLTEEDFQICMNILSEHSDDSKKFWHRIVETYEWFLTHEYSWV